jgi:hypothetical protein
MIKQAVAGLYSRSFGGGKSGGVKLEPGSYSPNFITVIYGCTNTAAESFSRALF